MSKKNILLVAGTRPNFIKITQLRKAFAQVGGFDLKIVHTGQHYDHRMSKVFFEQFGLQPDFFLNIESKSQIGHLSEIMQKLDELVRNTFKPDAMLVLGDVTSTLAGALVANKSGIPLGHIESGLRSEDERMPEEINRILTDRITDIHFVTEQSGIDNLKRERLDHNTQFVGNTMIDTLVAHQEQIDQDDILEKLEIKAGEYLLVTLHRPALVDDPKEFERTVDGLLELSKDLKLVFPIHPRSYNKLESFGLLEKLQTPSIKIIEPQGYFAFQKLIRDSKCVLTDSGGIQEETTFLGVPCLTMRPNTERPVTITQGTNELVPNDFSLIQSKVQDVLNDRYKKGTVPELWDGQASLRIAKAVSDWLNG